MQRFVRNFSRLCCILSRSELCFQGGDSCSSFLQLLLSAVEKLSQRSVVVQELPLQEARAHTIAHMACFRSAELRSKSQRSNAPPCLVSAAATAGYLCAAAGSTQYPHITDQIMHILLSPFLSQAMRTRLKSLRTHLFILFASSSFFFFCLFRLRLVVLVLNGNDDVAHI